MTRNIVIEENNTSSIENTANARKERASVVNSSLRTSNVRMSVTGKKSLSGLGGFRASNALNSIMAF